MSLPVQGNPLAIANAATASTNAFLGLTVAETGAAVAHIRVRDASATGDILATIKLASGGSTDISFPAPRLVESGTLYVQVVSGAVEGSVFYA